MDTETLAHTKWNCKYHIVFAPKFRRQIIYGRLKTEIGKILRTLCERKEIEILEANLCADHIHMLKYALIGLAQTTGLAGSSDCCAYRSIFACVCLRLQYNYKKGE